MGLFDFSGFMGGDATAQQPSPADLQTIQSMAPGGAAPAMPAAPAPGMFSGYSDAGQSAMKWAMAADIISNLRGGDGKALSMIGPLLEQNRQRQALKDQREAMSGYMSKLSPEMQKLAHAFPGEAAKAALGYQFNTAIPPETFTQMKGPNGRLFNVGSRGKVTPIIQPPIIDMSKNLGGEIVTGEYKKLGEYEESYEQAHGEMLDIDQFSQLINSLPEGKIGPYSEWLVPAMRWANNMGVDVDRETLMKQEGVVALGNRLILPQVKQLGVNPTDKDLTFVKNASPTLGKSKAGNLLMLKALRLSTMRRRDLNLFRKDWVSNNMAVLGEKPSAFLAAKNSAEREFLKGYAEQIKDLEAEVSAFEEAANNSSDEVRTVAGSRH